MAEGTCEFLSVEIGRASGSQTIDMTDVGVDRYRLAAAAYHSELMIGDALHVALHELWALGREFFRPFFELYAAGASIAMRAGRGLEWLNLPEMVLLGGATSLAREALRAALTAMLGSRGHLRQVRERDGATLAQLHSECRLWGAAANYSTLGVVMDSGSVPANGPYANEEARNAAKHWGTDLRELERLVSSKDSPACDLAISFNWGRPNDRSRVGDPWAPTTLAALARRDVIVVAHAPVLAESEFIIQPVGTSLRVRGSELMEKLSYDSTSHTMRQIDLSICDSRRLIEVAATKPTMLMLGVGGLTQRSRLYRGVHELITSQRATRILGRPVAFLGVEAPSFPTARALVRALMLEEIYGELARNPPRTRSNRASSRHRLHRK